MAGVGDGFGGRRVGVAWVAEQGCVEGVRGLDVWDDGEGEVA